MMHLILAESELELNPWNKRELLDSSIHHKIMRRKHFSMRRGRPDIVHFFLVVAMESILNKAGLLRVYIHTRNNEVIYIAPETRIIKNYNRFKGLMAQLLRERKIASDERLIWMEEKRVEELLEEIKGKKILFTRKGRKINVARLHEVMEDDVVCIIGGFPSGYFMTELENMVDAIVSIYDDMLTAWTVAMEAIAAYERFKFR
ncbi:MAG: 16S rRNA methyltransferase [Thermoplasmata archaeon]|nr:16S rRNA methyltransferase [Thermoplasmata archaeon]